VAGVWVVGEVAIHRQGPGVWVGVVGAGVWWCMVGPGVWWAWGGVWWAWGGHAACGWGGRGRR